MENLVKKFKEECKSEIGLQGKDECLSELSLDWYKAAGRYKYGYHFTWLGRPIIQLPTDIVAMQELIWNVKPDVIIETGIAHGGSLIFYASMMVLLQNHGKVIGVDIDIRAHNRAEIEKHPMFPYIHMIEGSSIEPAVVGKVKEMIDSDQKVMVVLDSCHTHDHVLKELELYSPLVSKESYLVCMDTIVEYVADEFNGQRPWGKGDNPMTVLQVFLRENNRFEIDTEIDHKLLVSESPHGFLRCVK